MKRQNQADLNELRAHREEVYSSIARVEEQRSQERERVGVAVAASGKRPQGTGLADLDQDLTGLRLGVTTIEADIRRFQNTALLAVTKIREQREKPLLRRLGELKTARAALLAEGAKLTAAGEATPADFVTRLVAQEQAIVATSAELAAAQAEIVDLSVD